MNLAFDARGRLWVSCSEEYPFPAPLDRKGKDSIRILVDADHDGRAEKSIVFADGLNIPIGLYPYKNGVIAFSIPYIYYFEDSDGDDKADKREILYGPLGYERDAHGLNNGFRRGFDGWLYAAHGYNNATTIKGKDGSHIEIISGNTYRIRLDGSRVEQFTYGQVNPFGLAFDPLGDLYSADCHTKPLMLLLRGGCYDSFGRPHNGLGYVPSVMEHLHGSTAIAGVADYTGSNFPDEYQGNMFMGNVMTSRVNRDSIQRRGSTVVAVEEPDFVATNDPWFRPVDIQIGPDGAMYIADFYNKIIGHYEVPLNHPGRDRNRGRIWRVRYVGDPKSPAQLSPSPDLRAATIQQLIEAFDHPVLGVRMRATDEATDRIGVVGVPALKNALESLSAKVRVQALWSLFRLNKLDPADLKRASADSDALVRNHAMRVLSETSPLPEGFAGLLEKSLSDSDPLVVRSAADALGRHPTPTALPMLISAYSKASEADVHLRHTIKMALFEVAKTPGTLSQLKEKILSNGTKADAELLADVALAIPTPEAAGFLLDAITNQQPSGSKVLGYLSHAAKHLADEAQASRLANLAQQSVQGDLDLQVDLFEAARSGAGSRGGELPKALEEWGSNLAKGLFESIRNVKTSWSAAGVDGRESPLWGLEPRRSSDGKKQVAFLSSLPLGEGYTGVLKSTSFAIPPKLSFYLCGHLGFPDKPPIPENKVVLRLAEGGQAIAQALAPRNDEAQRVDWDLSAYAGKQGVIEVVDNINLSAYAWIAVSRFEPEVALIPQSGWEKAPQRGQAACRLTEELRLAELVPTLKSLTSDKAVDASIRSSAAHALLGFHPDPLLSALLVVSGDQGIGQSTRNDILDTVVSADAKASAALVEKVSKTLPDRLQLQLANALAGSPIGGEGLLQMADRGSISLRLLQQPGIRGQLIAAHVKDAADRIEKLTGSLPALSDQTQKLIDARRTTFKNSSPLKERGKEVFIKQCSACHQIAGQGALVGPQLDGIGNRGFERIVEDVLDPNRNVDPNFYSTIFALADGRVVSGLLRRKDGANFVVADSKGKEIIIPEVEIEERKTTKLSPMPADFGSTIGESEFNDLIAYLSSQAGSSSSIGWRAIRIDSRFRSEGAAIADVNRDGKPDVMVGELWYEAPSWKPHEITKPGDYGDGANGYASVFYCFADDVNQDGWPDAVVVGTPGSPALWYENPKGEAKHWISHPIWPSACNETPIYVDVFGNGKRVLVMAWQPEGSNDDHGEMAWFEPDQDLSEPWRKHAISEQAAPGRDVPGTHRFSHGLGVGDLNSDGKLDVMCTGGWWEQPGKLDDKPWAFHAADLGEAAANMHAVDMDGDGLADVLSSSAHGYGIWWFKQKKNVDGSIVFERKDLFPKLVSQTHALLYQDIDGDGLDDLVAGKRFWAHGPHGDVGQNDPAMLYWMKASKDKTGAVGFTPNVIHTDSGVGLHFAIGDINGDGKPDVVVSNKKGVQAFEQVAPKANAD